MRPEAERRVRAKVRRAIALAKAADRYTEKASMAADDAFRTLEHNARMGTVEEALADKAYKAHSHLSNARGEIGDAVYKLEQAQKKRATSGDRRRRRRR